MYRLQYFKLLSSEFQTSAFSPTIDEQYRQLYHPTEDYRNYGSDSSSPNSPYSYEGFANGYKRNYSQTNLDPIKEESGSKTVIQNKQNVSADTSVKNNSEQAQPQPEQPRPHSEQSRPQTDKNQALNVSPITQQKSLLNTSSQEAVSQGHGQQGLAQGQKSPVVQGQSSVIGQTKEQQSSQGQTVQVKGQEEDNSTVVQSLPVLMRQDVQSDIGQRSSTHPDQTDNLQELLKQVPAGQEPNVVNQPQETVLPPVQIQQGAKVREPSPPREGGHVRTNVSAAPRFTIQGSEDDEESPPSPKGKFFI